MTTRRLCALVGLVSLWGLVSYADAPENIHAWADLEGSVHIRWTTATLTKGHVAWGARSHLLDRVVEEDPSCLRGTTNNRDSGEGWANNHRADFPGTNQWPVFAKIRGTTRDGDQLEGNTITIQRPEQAMVSGEGGQVPIIVDAGDWPLESMPLTFGVPFPPGTIERASQVRVVGMHDACPTQARVVTRWHRDGSVKWLRVNTIVPKTEKKLVLEYEPSVAPGTPSTAEWTRLTFSPTITLKDTEERSFTYRLTGRPEAQEMGAVKAVTQFSGPLKDDEGRSLGRAIVRIHAWQGLPVTRLDVTLENDAVQQEMTAIRSAELNLAWPEQSVRVGRIGHAIELKSGDRLLQHEDFEWKTTASDQHGKRIDGICRPANGPAIILRHFWEQWPGSIELQEGQLTFGLCPTLPRDLYKGRDGEDKFYYHVRDGLHTFRQGWSKTWELWQAPPEAADALAGAMPVACVDPEWLEKSNAFGLMAVGVRDQFPGYDLTLAKAADGYAAERDSRREYGMMNFGDWYGERRWNWGNLEYDLGHAFLMQYARTGHAAFRRHADEILRHQRDVDTRHYARDPRRVGQQWIHSIGHTAGYYPDTYKDMKSYAGRGWSDNRGHIWAQGMFEHYLLGGDTRSWETALLIADWAAGPQTTNFRFGNAREPGWMTKLVMSAYTSTEDPFYLNAATLMLEATHAQSIATDDHGFYYHILPKGHCNCVEGDKHYGEAGFMLGVLMTGMKMYYDVTGSKTVADDIAKTARFIVDTMWEPLDCGFRYTSCPETNASGSSGWIMMEGLAFGARHAGDDALADTCREAMVGAWRSLPRSGKSAGYALCNAPRALQEVAQLPGMSFREYRHEQERILSSPARRDLPTRVPNPDFEESIRGWPTRGWTAERTTRTRHGGTAALRISGEKNGQNEYLNTRYDTSGSPLEITWLEPGKTYLLTAWLRVDRITPGTPAPDLRLAYRDSSGSRTSEGTTAYDLSHSGTWQQLSGVMTVPEWNTRNYIALNTNTRKTIDVDMYLDDVHLTPIELPPADTPTVVRLDPDQASLAGGAGIVTSPAFRGQPAVAGPGSAVWSVDTPPPGKYLLWVRAAQDTLLRSIAVGETTVAREVAVKEPGWVKAGTVVVPEAGCQLRLEGLSPGSHVGRLVLTDVQ